MTVSKFLMNVAVCAVGIGGISTSYGADSLSTDTSAAAAGLTTPVRRVNNDGMGSADSSVGHLAGSPSWSGVPRGVNTDPDARSVSSMSFVDNEQLTAGVRGLWNSCKQSGLPAPSGNTQLERLQAYVDLIVNDRKHVTEAANTMTARIAELEAAAAEKMKADQVAQSLTDENTAAGTREQNAVFWRNVAGGVGVVALSLAIKVVYDNWSRVTGILM